jgi:hypothetical protein
MAEVVVTVDGGQEIGGDHGRVGATPDLAKEAGDG